jgi:hypothetical protein
MNWLLDIAACRHALAIGHHHRFRARLWRGLGLFILNRM